MYITAQILGGFALLCWVMSIFLKEKKDILLTQIVANLIYSVEYSLLNVFQVASMNFCSFIRLLIYYLYEKKNKQVSKFILIIFICIIIIIGLVTYNNLFTFIPTLIAILYAYSFWQSNLLVARIIYIGCAFVWIYYNSIVGAHIGVIGNILEIIAGTIAIISYKKTVLR